jgi:hypothetical protein
MKKIISLSLSCLGCLLFFTSHIQSQLPGTRPEGNEYTVVLQNEKKFNNGYKNNIPPDILRDFEERFEDAEKVNWIVDDKEITAYFICDYEKVVARYKNDGRLISTHRDYSADRLAKNVARLVRKNAKANMQAYLVTEVDGETNSLYQVSLQNESDWCILLILKDKDGFLSIINKTSFKKA